MKTSNWIAAVLFAPCLTSCFAPITTSENDLIGTYRNDSMQEYMLRPDRTFLFKDDSNAIVGAWSKYGNYLHTISCKEASTIKDCPQASKMNSRFAILKESNLILRVGENIADEFIKQ